MAGEETDTEPLREIQANVPCPGKEGIFFWREREETTLQKEEGCFGLDFASPLVSTHAAVPIKS